MKSSLISQVCDSNDSKAYTIYKKWQNNYSIKPDEFLKTIDSSFRHIKLDGEIIYLAKGPFFDAFSSIANKYIYKTYSETIKYDSYSTSFEPEDRIELEELKEIRKNAKKGFENGGNVFFNELGGFYNDLNFYEKVLMLEILIKDYCSQISLGCCLTPTWLYNYGFLSRCLWDACEERKRILRLHIAKGEIKSTYCYYLLTESWKAYLFKDDITPSSCFAVCLGNFEMNQQSENGISASELYFEVENASIKVPEGGTSRPEINNNLENVPIEVPEGEISASELYVDIENASIKVQEGGFLLSELNDNSGNTSIQFPEGGISGTCYIQEKIVLIESINLRCDIESIKERWVNVLLNFNKTPRYNNILFFENKEQIVWLLSIFFSNFKRLANPASSFDLSKIPKEYDNTIRGLMYYTYHQDKVISKLKVNFFGKILYRHLCHFFDGTNGKGTKLSSLNSSLNKYSDLKLKNKKT